MSALSRRMLSGFVCSLVAVCCASAVVADGPKASASAKTSSSKIVRNFGNLPLSFEPNRGQSDPRVKFIARAHNETLFLTQKGATIALTHGRVPDYRSLASRGSANGIKNAAFKVPSPQVETSAARMEFVGASGSSKIEGSGAMPELPTTSSGPIRRSGTRIFRTIRKFDTRAFIKASILSSTATRAISNTT
jgi:hypothetical protein